MCVSVQIMSLCALSIRSAVCVCACTPHITHVVDQHMHLERVCVCFPPLSQAKKLLYVMRACDYDEDVTFKGLQVTSQVLQVATTRSEVCVCLCVHASVAGYGLFFLFVFMYVLYMSLRVALERTCAA